jgi:hypothetical protein
MIGGWETSTSAWTEAGQSKIIIAGSLPGELTWVMNGSICSTRF